MSVESVGYPTQITCKKTSQESVILLDYYYVFLNQDIVGGKIMLRHCHHMSYMCISEKKGRIWPLSPLQPHNLHPSTRKLP